MCLHEGILKFIHPNVYVVVHSEICVFEILLDQHVSKVLGEKCRIILFDFFKWRISEKVVVAEVFPFVRKGTEKVHEEIRDFFFANPNFTHSDIALAAGGLLTFLMIG